MIRRVLTLMAAACALLYTASVARAATFTVNDPADHPLANASSTSCASTSAGSCTLRAAVQAADNAGGANVIVLPAGDFKLTIPPATASTTGDPSTGDLDVIGLGARADSLTIKGAGSGHTIVDANQVDRAFAVQSGNALTLSGMTIENGDPGANSTASDEGGAIYSNGVLTITSDVLLSGNSGTLGGAIYADAAGGSAVSLTGASFTGNTATAGGAIYDDTSGAATISSSQFTANAAGSPGSGDGGAIAVEGGTLTISSSQFRSNTSGADGGAIDWEASGGTLTVTGTTFTDDTAETGGAVRDDGTAIAALTGDRFIDNAGSSKGGALYLNSGSSTAYTLDSDEFDGNSSSQTGGAIQWNVGEITSTGSSFTDNRAAQSGGAIEAESPNALSLTNDTISDNAAAQGAGIYYEDPAPASFANDTITGNTAQAGGGIFDPSSVITAGGGAVNTIIAQNAGGDCNVKFTAGSDGGHNLDGDGSCFAGLGATGDLTDISDPLIGPPADNGGQVLTDALQGGSVAIDAGAGTGCPATDARGVPRPQGSACDMGAFEVAGSALALTDSAPAHATAGLPYDLTITVKNTGPGPSTNTMVSDHLQAGMTLYGVTQSQGSCTSSGPPASVSCSLGVVAPGAGATVALVVADSPAGTYTDAAAAANDESGTATATATTRVAPAPPPTARPVATTGHARAVKLTSVTLSGKVSSGGQSSSWFFQYGTDSSYGEATPVRTTTSATASVSAQIGGLAAGQRYHYRLVAINSSGVSKGADRTVTTKRPAKPKVILMLQSQQTNFLPFTYMLAGRLTLPRGVTRARGCHGSVAITISITGRTGTIASGRAPIRRNCTYGSVTLVPSIAALLPLFRPAGFRVLATLTAVAKFPGNRTLVRSRSKPVTLRLR